MTNLASSTFTSRRHMIGYWVTTAMVVFELAMGGVWDILRVPQVRGLIEQLGYPLYFLVILGIWKLLGAVALVIPRFPRLKEWAYAGVIFDLTGAVASLWASRLIDVGTMAYPIVMTGVAVASWALRPPSRRLSSVELP
jgi:uncharacterized membrane protein YphA (DoxX/SURF4 family)